MCRRRDGGTKERRKLQEGLSRKFQMEHSMLESTDIPGPFITFTLLTRPLTYNLCTFSMNVVPYIRGRTKRIIKETRTSKETEE